MPVSTARMRRIQPSARRMVRSICAPCCAWSTPRTARCPRRRQRRPRPQRPGRTLPSAGGCTTSTTCRIRPWCVGSQPPTGAPSLSSPSAGATTSTIRLKISACCCASVWTPSPGARLCARPGCHSSSSTARTPMRSTSRFTVWSGAGGNIRLPGKMPAPKAPGRGPALMAQSLIV